MIIFEKTGIDCWLFIVNWQIGHGKWLPVCSLRRSLSTNLIICTPRCQINESTRLSFLDFSPTLYLDMSYLISYPTRLFGPTHFAFPPYSFGPIFYEIDIQYPPYLFIRYHLRFFQQLPHQMVA